MNDRKAIAPWDNQGSCDGLDVFGTRGENECVSLQREGLIALAVGCDVRMEQFLWLFVRFQPDKLETIAKEIPLID
jgi:hypothetical protein